ncbi:hypothetical protein J6590_055673 [Homalodisca vitripennis]|nr:hypothetical protein J6590_055673 [Homalodisca vitripennis]
MKWIRAVQELHLLAEECTGSICLAYGLESCQCIPQPHELPTKACELCCKMPGEDQPCLSSFVWNSAPYDIPDMFSKPGTPCNDYNGYCDVFQKCREELVASNMVSPTQFQHLYNCLRAISKLFRLMGGVQFPQSKLDENVRPMFYMNEEETPPWGLTIILALAIAQKREVVDPSGPLATLRKLLLSEESIASFKRWILDRWYYAALICASVILILYTRERKLK